MIVWLIGRSWEGVDGCPFVCDVGNEARVTDDLVPDNLDSSIREVDPVLTVS